MKKLKLQRMGKDGRIWIPKEIRDKYSFEVGDYIALTEKENEICIKKPIIEFK